MSSIQRPGRLRLPAAGEPPKFAPVPEGVARLASSVVVMESADKKRAEENCGLYQEYRIVTHEEPKHFERWVGTDAVSGFASDEVDRMHVKYKEIKRLVQDAKREVHDLRARIVAKRFQPLDACDRQTLNQLGASVRRMHDHAKVDLDILWERTQETAEVCKVLRVADIDDATGFFRYVPRQLQQPALGELDADGNPKKIKPFIVNVPWFGKSHHVEARNTVQLAGLQKIFLYLSSHMFTLRLRHVQPCLSELIFLRDVLDSLVSGQINLADCWPQLTEVPVCTLADLLRRDFLIPAFEPFGARRLQPFAEYWDVHKFLQDSRQFWRPELERLEDRTLRYAACGRGLLSRSDKAVRETELLTDRGVLDAEEVQNLRISHQSLWAPLSALRRDLPVIAELKKRVQEGLIKLDRHKWLTDVFSEQRTTLHYGDDASRDAVGDSYKELDQRLRHLHNATVATANLFVSIRATFAQRAAQRGWPTALPRRFDNLQPMTGSLVDRAALLASGDVLDNRHHTRAFEKFLQEAGCRFTQRTRSYRAKSHGL